MAKEKSTGKPSMSYEDAARTVTTHTSRPNVRATDAEFCAAKEIVSKGRYNTKC